MEFALQSQAQVTVRIELNGRNLLTVPLWHLVFGAGLRGALPMKTHKDFSKLKLFVKIERDGKTSWYGVPQELEKTEP